MKLWLAGIALLPWVAYLSTPPKPRESMVIITGDWNGYLSPCGCTKPMQGGIRRLGTLVKEIRAGSPNAILVANGPLGGPPGRQSELKAETLAESLRAMRVSGIGLSANDVDLGVGVVLSVASLSGGKLISSSTVGSERAEIPESRVAGHFRISSLSASSKAISDDLNGVEVGLAEWKPADTRPQIVLLDGTEADARLLAARTKVPLLVVYRLGSSAPSKPIKIGTNWLVSPGEKGKSALRIGWNGKAWTTYQAVSLGPEYKDDPAVSALYQSYLKRVGAEDLLSQLPRTKSDAFAGTEKCISCHPKDGTIWHTSAHAKAFATLEADGHHVDPDCVGCHVVGLDKSEGFKSKTETFHLKDVGCESCHGPGEAHSKDPMLAKLPAIGERSCMSCHNLAHSPNFNYQVYWEKVKHGYQEKP